MKEIIEAIKESRFVFICGNGGSAATAEHFTTDLVKKGIKAICLNSNSSVMTMIANDYGYGEIFRKQLEVYADKDDLLITISCSGISTNIILAQKAALNMGIPYYSFKTFDKKNRDYQKLEDEHLKFAHEVIKNL